MNKTFLDEVKQGYMIRNLTTGEYDTQIFGVLENALEVATDLSNAFDEDGFGVAFGSDDNKKYLYICFAGNVYEPRKVSHD